MTISIKRFVDITSGVAAGAVVAQRELIGCLFTTHQKVPLNTSVEMTSATDVANYFGSDSEEAKRAFFYFDFISKNISRPKKLMFVRYSPDITKAAIFGGRAVTQLVNWKTINNGSLTITINGIQAALTGLNFTNAATLADVATVIQNAFNQKTDAVFVGSTVEYDALASSFNFHAGAVGNNECSIDGGNIVSLLGWDNSLTVVSQGTTAETPLDAFLRTAERNNNFGSFAFINDLSHDDVVLVAQANSGRNVEFMYCIPVRTYADAETLSHALIDLSGCSLTYAPKISEYDELAPTIVLASTDYTRRNSTQNYMFQTLNLTAKVETNADADYLDNLRVNYMGVTQTAGQLIKFYQRGVMTGLATAPVDMNTYANEMWFKDAMAANLMQLLLASAKVSANDRGRAQIIAISQSVIDKALENGVISIDKPFSETQKLYINETTGDYDAWRQVQARGYWLDCEMQSTTTKDGRAEWKAVYTLIYSKDDVIRKIEGTHALI